MNFKSDWINSTQTYQEHMYMKGKERTTHVECSGVVILKNKVELGDFHLCQTIVGTCTLTKIKFHTLNGI